MIDNETLNGNSAYTLTAMLYELRRGLWSEVYRTANIDAFRRNLQRAHVERLGELINQDTAKRSDISAAARAELKSIQSTARSAASKYRVGIVRYHLQDIDALVDEVLKID
jgi:hypothetical protein